MRFCQAVAIFSVPAVAYGAASDAVSLTVPKKRKAISVTVPNKGKAAGMDAGDGVAEFRGIPYARPPVGALRWQPPEAHPGWGDETLQATAFGTSCMQPAFMYSEDQIGEIGEDCLFLNIATPKAALRDGTEKLPVMLAIHGGGFFIGGGFEPDIQNAKLVASSGKKVVAVSINYRLSVFGFLGGSEVMERSIDGGGGNFGIQDQQAAMAWVKENIGAFGGDGNEITIYGESSGGLSVMNHLARPDSFPLYKKAIIESGQQSVGTITMADAELTYEEVLEATDCTILACLVDMDAKTLFEAIPFQHIVANFSAPVVDGVTISDSPAALIASKRYNNKVPVLIGSNRDDGARFLDSPVALTASKRYNKVPVTVGSNHDEGARVVEPEINADMSEAEFDELMFYYFSFMTPEILADAKRVYSPDVYEYPEDLGWASIWYWTYVRFRTDTIPSTGACAVRWLARMLDEGGTPAVYTYLFAHPVKWHPNPPHPTGLFATHGLIVPFINGDVSPTVREQGLPGSNYTSEEQDLAQAMAKYWSGFAVSGNPNSNRAGKNRGSGAVTWPKFTTKGDRLLRLDVASAGGIKKQRGLRRAACDWQTSISSAPGTIPGLNLIHGAGDDLSLV